jgi:hypothetical protein
MKLVASTLALFAAAAAFATPAAAATAPAQFAVQADLNGDGTLDRVVVKAVPDDEFAQSVIATVGRANYVARTEFYAPEGVGVQQPRVVDVNDDGRDEVLVTESVGANTYKFTVWGVSSHGWGPVVYGIAPDVKFAVWEGGGAEYFDRYGCEPDPFGGRRIVSVYASKNEHEIFWGGRITYGIYDGSAWTISSTSVSGTRNSSVWHTDPQACV